MAKILSEKEAGLQKKLIPLNIVVLVLSLVATLSLIFAPLLKIDVGKFLRDEAVIEFVEEELENVIDGDGGQADGEEVNPGVAPMKALVDAGQTDGGGFGLDFTPIITSTVVQVLSKANGTITFSTFEVCRYAADSREDKLEILLDGLIYGKTGIVTELVDSLSNGIKDAFTTEEGKEVIEGAVVESVISSIGGVVSSVGGEDASEIAKVIDEKLTDEKTEELTNTFLEINDAKSEDDVVKVVDTFVDQLNETLGDDYNISEEDKETVTEYMVDLYNKTIDAIEASGDDSQEFSLEAMICVAVSENVDLGEINISEMLKQFTGDTDGSTADSSPSAAGKTLTEETTDSNGTPLTYTDLFGQVGLGEEEIDELSSSIADLVKSYADSSLESVNESLKSLGGVYKYIYVIILAVLAIFIVPWFILALTALIRTFTKNKRYSMWYVKCLGFELALIFVALFVLKTWGVNLLFGSMDAQTLGIAKAALGAITSFTWICGLCYILLWLVSIFWAFPIKHKIRKERKACKRAKA